MATDSIKEISIPYIPAKVEINHLKENGKLLSDPEIQAIKSTLTLDGIYSRKESQCSYRILKKDERYFAIYLGGKHKDYGNKGKLLGKGSFANIKLVQDLDSGEWFPLKTQKLSPLSLTEADILEKIDELLTTTQLHPVTFSANKLLNGADTILAMVTNK